MFLVRDIMYCKPGKGRALAEKFLALSNLIRDRGVGNLRVLTDISTDSYWTVVAEMEVASLDEYTQKSRESMQLKEFQDVMKGYHDFVDHGRREIYNVEQ